MVNLKSYSTGDILVALAGKYHDLEHRLPSYGRSGSLCHHSTSAILDEMYSRHARSFPLCPQTRQDALNGCVTQPSVKVIQVSPSVTALNSDTLSAYDKANLAAKVYYESDNKPAVLESVVEGCLDWVRGFVARKYNRLPSHFGLDVDDLVSAVYPDLVNALSRYDPSKAKFITFAAPRIGGAIKDYFRTLDWVPRLDRRRAKQNGSSENLPRMIQPGVSEKGTDALQDRPDDSEQFGELVTNDCMSTIMRGFGHRDKLLVSLLYCEDLTMKEIGKVLGISESRVSQLHTTILDGLRSKGEDNLRDMVA